MAVKHSHGYIIAIWMLGNWHPIMMVTNPSVMASPFVIFTAVFLQAKSMGKPTEVRNFILSQLMTMQDSTATVVISWHNHMIQHFLTVSLNADVAGPVTITK